jgi:hypothetical protein
MEIDAVELGDIELLEPQQEKEEEKDVNSVEEEGLYLPKIEEKSITEIEEIRAKREDCKEEMVSILLFLKLRELGAVSVRMVAEKGYITCSIKAENREGADLIKRSLSQLNMMLQGFGWRAKLSAEYADGIRGFPKKIDIQI